MDYPPEKVKHYTLQVPIALELNFTQVGFDTWVKEKATENKKTNLEKAKKQLTTLRGEYPELF